MKKEKTKIKISIRKNPFEGLKIERIICGDNNHITAVDLHDERFGEAIFCKAVDRHFHGFYKSKGKTTTK